MVPIVDGADVAVDKKVRDRSESLVMGNAAEVLAGWYRVHAHGYYLSRDPDTVTAWTLLTFS